MPSSPIVNLVLLSTALLSSPIYARPAATSIKLERAGAATVTLPPVNGKADYQLGGAYTPDSDVQIVHRDRTEAPAAGLYNVCYINAFQTQDVESSWWQTNHPDLLLKKKDGSLFEDPDWEGEYFLDTTTDAKRQALATILNGWIDGCLASGFNAIEPDNLDTFTRSNKLITQANNLALAALFTAHAHSIGLAVAQKNAGSELGQAGKQQAGFDFAVAEECQEFDECDAYTDVYGNQVIEIEYSEDGLSNFDDACDARGSKISIIYRDINVYPKGHKGYVYQAC